MSHSAPRLHFLVFVPRHRKCSQSEYRKAVVYSTVKSKVICLPTEHEGGGGDRGAGARENRGREGYGRRKRKGREAGVLIGLEAGEKCGTLMFFYSTMR